MPTLSLAERLSPHLELIYSALHSSLRSLYLTFHVSRVGVHIALERLLQLGVLTSIKVQRHSIQFHAAELKIHRLWSMSSRNDTDKPDSEERSRKTIKVQPCGPFSVEINSSSRGNEFFRSGHWPWSQKTGMGVSVLFVTKCVILLESWKQRSSRFLVYKMETIVPRIASLYWYVLPLACSILSATWELHFILYVRTRRPKEIIVCPTSNK